MSRINRINIQRISEIRTNINHNKLYSVVYIVKDVFNFSEIGIEGGKSGVSLDSSLVEVLFSLFRSILIDGADIVPRASLTDKKIIIEASFKPPISKKSAPQIFLPLPGISMTLKAVRRKTSAVYLDLEHDLKKSCSIIAKECDYRSLMRLIIITSHEYGHFISYLKGLHTQELKLGLSIMLSKQITSGCEEYTYQIFSEELTAWRFAKEMLDKYNFVQWDPFDLIMKKSLQEYYKILKFDNIENIDVLCKLSMLNLELNNS